MADPPPIDVDTPEGSVDLDFERDGELFEIPLEVLDTAYIQDSLISANRLLDENQHWWMTTVSGFCRVVADIRDVLRISDDCELKSSLEAILVLVPSVSCPPPAPRLLLPELPKPTNRKRKAVEEDKIHDIIYQLKVSYRKEFPQLDANGESMLLQSPTDVRIPLAELPRHINDCHGTFQLVENLNLRNGAIFGQWIDLAYTRFQEEKALGTLLIGTFEQWLTRFCSVKPRWARELRYFFELCRAYPQLLRCCLPLSFFSKHRIRIREFFKHAETIAAKWSHNLECNCGYCGPLDGPH